MSLVKQQNETVLKYENQSQKLWLVFLLLQRQEKVLKMIKNLLTFSIWGDGEELVSLYQL